LRADSLIARAQQLYKAGDRVGAAQSYKAWLAINPGAPGSGRVFASYFSLEQEYGALREVSRTFLVAGRGVPGAGEQFSRIARLFDLGGMTEEARNAYLSAYGEGAPEAAMVSAFLLSLQMNDTEAMKQILVSLGEKGGTEKALLDALVPAPDGACARNALKGLVDASADSELRLRALWVLYAMARNVNDEKGQADIRARLAAEFPGAPETALASLPVKTGVVLFPSPDVLGTTDPPDSAPGATQTSHSSKFSVQAGSFQVKENADDLVVELVKRGFSPIEREESSKGKALYRVLAAGGLDADQARELLSKLVQAGFNGILVAEK
jgi:hypothetical protein